MNGLIFHLATLMFVGLKLTNNIDWSWWLVLAPSWGLVLFNILVGFFVLLWFAFNNPRFRRQLMKYTDALNHNLDLWNSKSREFVNYLGAEFISSEDPKEKAMLHKVTDRYAKMLEDIHKNWKISEVTDG